MTRESINTRALDAIAYLLNDSDLHKKSTIANDLGISASKLSEILAGRMKAGTEILAGLSSEYNISSQWLLTGEGDMVDSDILKSEQEYIENKLPCTDEFKYVNNDNGGKVPVVHELTFATFDPDDPLKVNADDYYYIKEFRNADFLYKLSGDYMSPKYRSGDLIACRNVKHDNFYAWGRIYALLTCHQGIIVGRVYERNNLLIDVQPCNPDYPTWTVPFDEIARMALVIGAISMD